MIYMSLIPKASKLLKPELKLETGTLTIHYYNYMHKYFQNTPRYIRIYNTSIWIYEFSRQLRTRNCSLVRESLPLGRF